MEEIKDNAPQTVWHDVPELKKSDYMCLDTNMGKIVTLKTLTSKKRYFGLFGDQNWQDSYSQKLISLNVRPSHFPK